jgi:hypothetical protein
MGMSGQLQAHAKRMSCPHRLGGWVVNSLSELGKEECPKATAEVQLQVIQPSPKYITEEPTIDHDDDDD